MTIPIRIAPALVAAAIAIAACGGDSSGPAASSTLSFVVGDVTIDLATASATSSSGTITIQAQGTVVGEARTLSIAVQASAVGTFPVGTVGGASVVYTELAAGTSVAKQWEARNGSGSGTLVLSLLTATRAVGTFSATLPPVTSSGATAAKSLSAGVFDVALAATR